MPFRNDLFLEPVLRLFPHRRDGPNSLHPHRGGRRAVSWPRFALAISVIFFFPDMALLEPTKMKVFVDKRNRNAVFLPTKMGSDVIA